MRAERAVQRNRAQRLAAILERDGRTCVWCRRPFQGLVRPTTEHLVPRLKGGPSWIENEVAACNRCNRARGHQSPSAWLDDCERLGLTPNREAIVRCLVALEAAVEVHGGQRRARPYLAAQIRRLTKR